MFYYLNGVVAHMAPFLAVIDCGGVGYACRTTNNTLSHLQKGKPAKLYTHLNVREDAMELFGFSTENELNCFQLLTSVSGVGPKAALSILSAATPESSAEHHHWDESRPDGAPGHREKSPSASSWRMKDKRLRDRSPLEARAMAAPASR